MLYNTAWETKTKPDVFSLEAFIRWLETMPADKTYNFSDCNGRCLLGQYMANIDVPWTQHNYEKIAKAMCRGYLGYTFYIGARNPHTFGAALERARAAHSAL